MNTTKKAIKAIFFDVDGTLLPFHVREMPQSTLVALHQLRANGVKLFIATGRHIQMLDTLRTIFPFDGYVTLNGQCVLVDDQVLRSEALPQEQVLQFVKEHEKNPFPCLFLEGDCAFITEITQSVEDFSRILDIVIPPLAPAQVALEREIYQMVAFLSEEESQAFAKKVAGPDYVRWHPDFVDVVPSGGGKELGIAVIGSYFQISPEEMMAFGDGDNDLTMLSYVGIGVGMGNATQPVLEQADFVTSSVEEEGIATGLRHFGLLPS